MVLFPDCGLREINDSVLLLFGMALGVAARRKFAGPARPVLVTAAVFSAVMVAGMASDINIGIQHILLVYPMMSLAAVAAVAGEVSLKRAGPRFVVAVLLLIWHGVESLAAHPDYLPYFNQVARGREEQFLSDSNLDWGQDLERLSGFLKDNPDPPFRLIYGGYARPELLGVPVLRRASAGEAHPGWLAVSVHRVGTSRHLTSSGAKSPRSGSARAYFCTVSTAPATSCSNRTSRLES